MFYHKGSLVGCQGTETQYGSSVGSASKSHAKKHKISCCALQVTGKFFEKGLVCDAA